MEDGDGKCWSRDHEKEKGIEEDKRQGGQTRLSHSSSRKELDSHAWHKIAKQEKIWTFSVGEMFEEERATSEYGVWSSSSPKRADELRHVSIALLATFFSINI